LIGGMKHACCRAARDAFGLPVGTANEIQHRIADTEAEALVLEMVPPMISLHPAAEPGVRPLGDVRHIVDPLIVQKRQNRSQHERNG
jgi:hypothetical protein